MSYDASMLLLAFGVPAVAIAVLCLAICKASGRSNRKAERDLDLLCYSALEGDLRNFHPERQSSSH